MKRLWFVPVLLSLCVPAPAQEDAPLPEGDGQWTTEATPNDGGDNGDKGDTGSKEKPVISVKVVPPKSEAGDEESVPVDKPAVKPTATIVVPKKGKPKVKAVKTAKSKPKVKAAPAAVTAKTPNVPPAPKVPPVPAVPLTPITPRNP